MSMRKNFVLSVVLGLAVLLAGAPRSEAKILIFKVTFVGKALFFPLSPPNGNSVKATGYLIYDTANPNNSRTVELFSNKHYEIDTRLRGLIVPGAINFSSIDKNQDGFFETSNALVGGGGGGSADARAYYGTNPRQPGFKVGGQFFLGPKSIKGKGSVTTAAVDHFTITDSWTLDPLSGLSSVFNSNTAADGVAAVQVAIEKKGYHL